MDKFRFDISLSVLNHLGRNLYRNFITVLGEAISNAWDADANNIWIEIDKENNILLVKDDGIGMSASDIQNRFLKVGYSKRKDNETKTAKDRPFIGRKGIGKLALLSSAQKISFISKTSHTEFTGGMISNKDLDEAITEDASQYDLNAIDFKKFKNHMDGLNSGTVLYFEELNDGIKNKVDYLRTLIALSFRFSLVDENFKIYLNGKEITIHDLDDFSTKTQYLWTINSFNDPYIEEMLERKIKENRIKNISKNFAIKGFIASVLKPADVKIRGTDEKVTVDLFVNGRLREKDILKHMPTARIVENYLYGQIHFDALDDEKDRFTSSREGVISEDVEFKKFLTEMKIILQEIIGDWDKWRIADKQDGDPEGSALTKKERKSKELTDIITDEYKSNKTSKNRHQIDKWVNELSEDAQYNISAYAECFVAENLLRNYIIHKGLGLNEEMIKALGKYKQRETEAKDKANISFDIRAKQHDLLYFSMDDLSNFLDKPQDKLKEAGLARDATAYKPVRDAMAHTSILTQTSKNHLNVTFENIKSRLKKLFED